MKLTTQPETSFHVEAAPLGTPGLKAGVLALLETSGAMQTPHTGRTLFDHLQGTYCLLQSWGNAEAVCLGGLFHSIYGTNAFAHQSLLQTQRAQLRAVVGEEAEALAWLFCSIDRPRAILQCLQVSAPHQLVELKARNAMDPAQAGQPVYATHPQLQALAEIECANLMEQGSWSSALRELYCAAIDGTAGLSAAAVTALRKGWEEKLSSQESQKRARA